MFRVLAEHNEWRLIGFDDKHFPDKRWLLDVIATFAPDLDIFRKDYLPPSEGLEVVRDQVHRSSLRLY